MDGLSAASAVFAVLQTAQEIGKGFRALRQMWNEDLPARLDSLSNQIQDLIVVLEETNHLLEDLREPEGCLREAESPAAPADEGPAASIRPQTKINPGYRAQTEANIRCTLAPCARYLAALRAIVEDVRIPSNSKVGPVRQLKSAHSWRKHMPRLNEIHQHVNSSKASLILILGKQTW